jgi:hypothetical protein
VRQYAAWTAGHPVQYVTATSATNPGLHPGTGYPFFVEASDGINWSAPGSTGTTTAPDVVPPSAPRDLAVATTLYGLPVDSVTASKVLLTWTNSTDDFGPISYQVLVDGTPSPNVFDTRPPGTRSVRHPRSGCDSSPQVSRTASRCGPSMAVETAHR